jgi:sulfite reductase alpha subunit-like flavoprotein
MTIQPVTRRSFLKLGCLAAAAGLTTCGLGLAVASPQVEPVELVSRTFGDPNMTPRILIAYASATGTTQEIAAEIGKRLAAAGAAVDVKPVREIDGIEGYQAVIIGSAVQYGEWLADAVEFVRLNREALDRVPTALFCVHIRNLEEDADSRRNREA